MLFYKILNDLNQSLGLLKGCERINILMALILVRYWFLMTNAANAAVLQLQLYHDLLEFQKNFPTLADTIISRLQNHLWYSSEEITLLAITSCLVGEEERQEVTLEIQKASKDQLRKGAMKMPPLVPGVKLASQIGPQSHHFFQALGIGTAWLEKPVSTWKDIPAYQKLASFVKNLPLSNDATECIINHTNDYSNYGAKGKVDFQATL